MQSYPLVQNADYYKKIISHDFVKKVILYGSRARTDARERSDIDIAIDCPTASEQEWLEILHAIEEADTLLKIDCVRYDSLSDKNPLKIAINTDGIVLYERRKP